MALINSLRAPIVSASVATGNAWVERLARFRDGLVASADFRRWAAAFPFTRTISRRRARALFDLVAGFAYSQVLAACVRLKLFDLLFEAPRTSAEIAIHTSLGEDSAQRLIDAAVSLRLMDRRSGGRYGLGALGAPMIDNAAVRAMVEHHQAFYADLSDPVALLRRAGEPRDTQLARYWPYAGNNEPQHLNAQAVASYSALMSASQPLVADEILRAYPLRNHRCLLDVGGGEGTFLETALRRVPRLDGILFDLPSVVDRASARLSRTTLASRTRFCGGDFFRDALPRGADVATLIRVLHDHDDASVLTLLRAVHAALPLRGRLLIAEPMAGTVGAEAMGDAYFGMYLLAMGRGRARTPQTLSELLRSAGFGEIRLLRSAVPLQTQLLVALRCNASSL